MDAIAPLTDDGVIGCARKDGDPAKWCR